MVYCLCSPQRHPQLQEALAAQPENPKSFATRAGDVIYHYAIDIAGDVAPVPDRPGL